VIALIRPPAAKVRTPAGYSKTQMMLENSPEKPRMIAPVRISTEE